MHTVAPFAEPADLNGILIAWVEAERGRLVLFLPVCMGAGIVAYFARRTEPSLWPACLLATLALLLACGRGRRPVPRAVLLAVGFAAAGFSSARMAAWRAPAWPDLPRTAVIVSGAVTGVEALPEGRRITIAAPSLNSAAPAGRAVRLRLRDTDAVFLAPGDIVRVRALLRPPSPPAYPGGWDMQRDAWFDGMGAFGFAIGPATRVQAATGNAWQSVRETAAARVMAALLGPRGAIAATLLTGLGAAIPQNDRAAFQVSGLAHLLAVAGLHIGIVMGLAFGLARLSLAASEHAALHWPLRRIAAVTALAAGLFYLELTGAHVPILRSFAMACLATLALLTGRRVLSVRALALAALPLMALAPALVMGVSFQMSFAAVLALVAGWEALAPRMATFGAGHWWRTPVLYVGGLAVTSALAGTASLPYAAYHFGTATLFYIPANMLAVPLTAFWVMPWGMAALALMPMGLERLALAPMGLGVSGLIAIAHAVAAWPGAAWKVPQMPAWGLLLVSGGLVWLCLWRARIRLAGLALLLAGMLSPFLVTAPDIVVSPDARLIALRLDGQVLVSTARSADRFALETPVHVWGIATAMELPAEGTAANGAVECSAGACRISLRGTPAAVLLDPAAPCSDAAIVLSAAPLRGRCQGAVVIDRFSVLDDGATSVRIGAGRISVTTDRDLRGDRPWVIARPRRTTPSALPPALTE